MKEVAEFIEMNDLAWRELMHLFNDIKPGRAKLALWKLFETAANMEHVNIFKSSTPNLGFEIPQDRLELRADQDVSG